MTFTFTLRLNEVIRVGAKPYDRCLYKKRKFGQTHTEERLSEDGGEDGHLQRGEASEGTNSDLRLSASRTVRK